MVDRNMRIVFMGTPDFAVPSLEILLEAGYPIAAVVTAPDMPGGRGMKKQIVSPVKLFALDHNLMILQPVNLKSKDFIRELKNLKADLQVVVAFRILPEVVWNMPPKGTMNLHGSLLPAYRGAAPIQRAIINGETTTGLTTFLLQHQIDTGHIIHQIEIPVLEEDDAGTLHDRMMFKGAGLVLGSVDLITSSDVPLKPQDETRSSHAPKIYHEDAHIDWNQPVRQVHNLVRGMSPFPGAWVIIDGLECKILRSRIHSNEENRQPGELWKLGKQLIAQAKGGELEIQEVQLAGKKRMAVIEFLNGVKIKDWSMT